ncbi:Nn.00g066970.m01.CDS01 [Neocucurbitaria sp. VM-36]
MEGVAVFSLACNIVQITELTRSIIRTAKEIRVSIDGATEANKELRDAATRLQGDTAKLQIDGDEDLRNMARLCQSAAGTHIALLDSLRLTALSNRWGAIRAAAKAIYYQRRLNESQMKIDSVSKQLHSHITRTIIPKINKKLENLGEDLKAHSHEMHRDMEIVKQQLQRVERFTVGSSIIASTTRDLIEQLREWIREQEKAQVNRQCLHALYFPQLRNRADQVEKAHEKTFSWIFDDDQGAPIADRFKFQRWLKLDDSMQNVFWISGKPGAGKSTLMKFIASHPCLSTHCKPWVAPQSLIIVDYYFWRQASVLQRSLRGLLQSLLYNILRQRPGLIDETFPDPDWVNGGAQFQFSQESLTHALQRILEIAPKHNLRLLILIDGLDEFDDRQETHSDEVPGVIVRRLFKILDTIQSCPSAKLCVSSRPLNIFQDTFEKNEEFYFRIHDLTQEDIGIYVKDILINDTTFQEVAVNDPSYNTLIEEITQAAEGVFIWVSLACNSLLDGLTNADHISDLQRRLRELPKELNDMYWRIMESIDAQYRKTAARSLIMLSSEHIRLRDSFLWHVYLDDGARKVILEHPDICANMGKDAVEALATKLRKQFNARTNGLLQVCHYTVFSDKYASQTETKVLLNCDLRVSPAHRTVVDFLKEQRAERWVAAQAGPYSDCSDVLTVALLAAFAAIVSFTGTIYSITIVEIPIGTLVREVLAKNMEALVARIEEANEEKFLQYWATFDRILNQHSSDGASIMEMMAQAAFLPLPSMGHSLVYPQVPTILDLAISCKALRFIEYKLNQIPSPIGDRLGDPSPLYTALIHIPIFYPSPELVRSLLERGAKPNQSFAGTTPWEAFLAQTLCIAYLYIRSLKVCMGIPRGRGCLVKLLIRYGAALDAVCHFLASGFDDFDGYPRSIWSLEETCDDRLYQDNQTKRFTMSSAAVLKVISDGSNDPEDKQALESIQLPPVPEDEAYHAVMQRVGESIKNRTKKV